MVLMRSGISGYKNLRDAVWEGMGRYQDCPWLLTSRVVGYLGYHKGPTPNCCATLRYLAPFADPQIKEFAGNWFSTRDRSPTRASEDATHLINSLYANPYTLRLARSPNLLTMMALIHRERARLPHGRALLYTDIANAYLQSIDEQRRIERLGYSLRDMKQWLGRIAFEMQLRRHRQNATAVDIIVEGQDVREWVLCAMRDAGRSNCSEAAADAFIDEICRRTGLLIPRGEDRFAFTHLSFQEFFAAVFFVSQFVRPPQRKSSRQVRGARREDLQAYVDNSMWHETLIFLAEVMFAEHPDWVEELLFCLFGENFSDVAPKTAVRVLENGESAAYEKISRPTLLAKMTIDPHAGLEECGLKWHSITCCCHYEAAEQNRMKTVIQSMPGRFSPELLPIFLDASSKEVRREVTRIFAAALHEADVRVVSLVNVQSCELSVLAQNCNLEVLDLSGSDVEDLTPLAASASLRLLNLHRCPVSDMGPLASLSRLEKLDLSRTLVSDVNPLASLSNLQKLDLSRTLVSDMGPLASLSRLEKLDLSRTLVSDVHPLASLSNLQKLDLSRTLVSDVSPLASLTRLQGLFLSCTPVNNLAPLTSLTKLKKLDLRDMLVSDVEPLAFLTELQKLDLIGTLVGDVRPLALLTQLQVLLLSDSMERDYEVRRLLKMLPDCRIVFWVGDDGMYEHFIISSSPNNRSK